MLPAASTLMRQLELVFATRCDTVSVPSLGTPAASVCQLDPPSVEIRMFTVGATLPPPTCHVTLNGTFETSVSPPFGDVAANGAPLTVTSISSHACPPLPGWLSRATSRNRISTRDRTRKKRRRPPPTCT